MNKTNTDYLTDHLNISVNEILKIFIANKNNV